MPRTESQFNVCLAESQLSPQPDSLSPITQDGEALKDGARSTGNQINRYNSKAEGFNGSLLHTASASCSRMCSCHQEKDGDDP